MISTRMKEKLCKVLVSPAMIYGLEIVALTKKQEEKLEVTEIKIWTYFWE